MKYLLIFFLIPFLSYAEIQVTMESDFKINPPTEAIILVEKDYEDLFNKKVFLKEIKIVLEMIKSNEQQDKIKIDLSKFSQKNIY